MIVSSVASPVATVRQAGPAGDADAPTAKQARDWQALLDSGRVPAQMQRRPEFLHFLCRQIEALAVNAVFEASRRTVPQDGLFSGGFAGTMFQGLADEQNAREIAAGGGFGVGDDLFRQLSARQSYAAALAAQGAAEQADAAANKAGLAPQGTALQPD